MRLDRLPTVLFIAVGMSAGNNLRFSLPISRFGFFEYIQ